MGGGSIGRYDRMGTGAAFMNSRVLSPKPLTWLQVSRSHSHFNAIYVVATVER